MKTTLKDALIALALTVFLTLAPDMQAKMKATKDCGPCCKQGEDCCDKCRDDKCAPCCEKKANAKTTMRDHIMMQGQRVLLIKEGKSVLLDKELTLSNGAKVMPDGTVTMKDGKKTMMKEGEMMTMDGEMMQHDEKGHAH